ncbi:MAG TPA: class I SAM-dependent methyltransferase [Gemmatimonadaceae bacterium]|nr:class I SAM-dependent methyltransferase [Gemmatimonadaceae bacterium]
MSAALVAVIILLAAVALGAGWYALQYRARHRQRGIFGRWPIRTIPLEELDPVFARTPFGPGHQTEVAYVGQGGGIPGGTSDAEAWILAVLAKRARAMFEFGTCTGKTTYLWARNAPDDAEIVTLTLAPDQHAAYSRETGDSARDVRHALKESAYERFFYSGTDVEPRITQLYGDSKQFDESEHAERYDLIFVDGSHAYSYVLSDAAKALRMCRPGGLILWHDYAGPRHSAGVYRALNELARRVPLVHVRGTTLVAHRKPAR